MNQHGYLEAVSVATNFFHHQSFALFDIVLFDTVLYVDRLIELFSYFRALVFDIVSVGPVQFNPPGQVEAVSRG